MKLLDTYIIRQFLTGMLPVVLLLLILFSFLALAEELERVGQGTFMAMDALLVVLATAPRRVVELLPVATLLGGLMGLGAMAGHQELVAARAAGMSRQRIARPVFWLATALAVAAILAQSFLIPWSEGQANELRSRALVGADLAHGSESELWARTGNNFVRVDDIRFGQLLTGVEIYLTDERGRVQQLIQAGEASVIGPDQWRLRDVSVTTLDRQSTRTELRNQLDWPELLSTEQASTLMTPLASLAPWQLSRLIDFQRENGLDSQPYRLIFWQQMSISLATIGMALLTLPLLLGSIRAMPAGQRIVLGGFVGIGFYLLQQMTGHLAGLFSLNPPATLLAPALLLIGIALYLQFIDDNRKRRQQRRARNVKSKPA